MTKKTGDFNLLTTPFEDADLADWDIYPRPQMKRDSFFSLNGLWELSCVFKGKETPLGKIKVPFVPESRLSGIFRTKRKGELYCYKKSFTLPEGFVGKRVLLHFGAVDQSVKVYINGSPVGEHEGGYDRFVFDVTPFLKSGENLISALVTDDLDTDLPYGKQRRKRGGMWYTPVSGIWQTVWLESTPREYIKSLFITTTLDSVTVRTVGGKSQKTLTLIIDGEEQTHTYQGDTVTVTVPSPRCWSPNDPYLYRFFISDGCDLVSSYFGLRTVTVEKRGDTSYICLNKKPFFFHGLLDQGYFSDGIFLPASPEGYKWDVCKMKELGFNMLRKHIKIEPDVFYYYCDKYGMAVFQDMVNSGRYSFLIDTALPTLGLKRGISHKAGKKRRAAFEKSLHTTADMLYNHPSVCCYTIFNEGWGQYDSARLYSEMKEKYPQYIWDTASGWFFESKSDVVSDHVYFKKLKMKKDPERPLVLSEFGGYSFKVEGHSFNPYNNYGYKSFATEKELGDGLSKLYLEQVLPLIENEGLCAAVLTQLSDVEDETNGMATYDRQKLKVDAALMNGIADSLYGAFEKRVRAKK